MRAPGEGEVYQAQRAKATMGFGEQEDLAAGLDEKRNEQAQRRGAAADRTDGSEEAGAKEGEQSVDVRGAVGAGEGKGFVGAGG